MNATDAQGLRKWESITIRKNRGKRTFQAMVTDVPTTVARPDGDGFWVLVPYRLHSRSHGATVETYSRHEHVATVGGRFPDQIERVR